MVHTIAKPVRPTMLLSRRAITNTRRLISSQQPRQSSIASNLSTEKLHQAEPSEITLPRSMPPPLSILPLSSVLRSLATTSLSSSKLLLPPSLWLMTKLAHTTNPVLSPDSNPLLRFLLKHTFYAQFCAGSNPTEVARTIAQIRSIGLNGVILNYALEVALDKTQTASSPSPPTSCIETEVKPWAEGTLETVRMTPRGDFAAIKFTGAGAQALYDLLQNSAPSPALKEAIDSICELAKERGVRLLFDAEQQAIQPGIDAWTLEYMRKYNKGSQEAVIYGTYQAYLKNCPIVLAEHLKVAQEEGFTLGVKLVRGAYLGSDPRELIHDTKKDTDACFDGIAESLARRSWNETLQPTGEKGKGYPDVSVVLAGHNITSVRKMMAIRKEQASKGETRVGMVYAQLQGMADEVSCEIVLAGKAAEASLQTNLSSSSEKKVVDIPEAYKYLVWGTTGQCMKYLMRRAHENKDAVERTREGRDAMARELWRRVTKAVSRQF